MTKVQMSCYGTTIIVDQDQVKLHEQKWKLVQASIAAQKLNPTSDVLFINNRSISAINKKIRKNVQFVK